jgi:hypothetical protein
MASCREPAGGCGCCCCCGGGDCCCWPAECAITCTPIPELSAGEKKGRVEAGIPAGEKPCERVDALLYWGE